jgi:hypothetical protein
LNPSQPARPSSRSMSADVPTARDERIELLARLREQLVPDGRILTCSPGRARSIHDWRSHGVTGHGVQPRPQGDRRKNLGGRASRAPRGHDAQVSVG